MKSPDEIIEEKNEVRVLMEMIRVQSMETYIHSLNVANLTYKMLEKIYCFTDEEKNEIITGALLHDIGKLFVPFRLTEAPYRLSPEEFEIVKIHANVSYEIVKPIFSKIVCNICLYHHERPNGEGYILNKRLADIPIEALIVQIADVYDALTANRVYKKAYNPKKALQIMHGEAKDFKLDDGFLYILEDILQKEGTQNGKELSK